MIPCFSDFVLSRLPKSWQTNEFGLKLRIIIYEDAETERSAAIGLYPAGAVANIRSIKKQEISDLSTLSPCTRYLKCTNGERMDVQATGPHNNEP